MVLMSFAAFFSIFLVLAASAQTAEDTYATQCATFHGASGTGDTRAGKALRAPDFHDAELLKASDADLATAITDRKNKMPAFGTKLTEAQIQWLV
jgi:mono/diheme cytochrome c family protein